MTADFGLGKQKRATPTTGQLLFGFFALFCLLLILRNSEVAIEYMSRGMLLCVRTVIPSLFPFMVISELIVSSGIGERLLRHISAPFRRLLGLSEAGCCALFLGMLCGFPVGAKCAVIAFGDGRITKEETERVLAFSGNPSSAFLISAVGTSLWGNRRFGTALYATVLAVELLTGFLMARLRPQADRVSSFQAPLSSAPFKSGSKLFTDAMRSATWSILSVCSYVIFFSALLGTLSLVLTPLALPESVRTSIFCLFEISSGVSAASALGNSWLAAVLCAFATGWSGLSVHCQILSVADGKGLSFRPYFLAKLFQGILCALVFGIIVSLCPALLSPMNTGVGSI